MTVPIRIWCADPLSPEVRNALDRIARTEDVARLAVMPDVHLAEYVCVGTVVATRETILPAAVGGDIGCGVSGIRFTGDPLRIRESRVAANVLADLQREVPPIRHRVPPSLPPELADTPLSCERLTRLRDRDGRVEFATLGRGNHFVELDVDEGGRLWGLVHSGSRAMGPAIRDHHLEHAARTSTGLGALNAEGESGRAYLADLAWALKYAEASRRRMLDTISEIVANRLGIAPDPESRIETGHNHVRREAHAGTALWVHRKGAIAAEAGTLAVIPGSMGTHSFVVGGRGHEDALRSASHGSGRALSRTEARKRIGLRTLERELHGVWFDRRNADQLRDEAPSAYKDVRTVMQAQRELVRIVHTLTPVLNHKG